MAKEMKGSVHQRMQILSATHPQVVPMSPMRFHESPTTHACCVDARANVRSRQLGIWIFGTSFLEVMLPSRHVFEHVNHDTTTHDFVAFQSSYAKLPERKELW